MKKVPLAITEKFEQVEGIIARANEASDEETVARNNYDAVVRSVSESTLKESCRNEAAKIKEIEDAQNIAVQIIQSGTLWEYENRPAPGENEKHQMSRDLMNQLIGKLTKHTDKMDNASLIDDVVKLQEGITEAKESVYQIKRNLSAYDNTARLDKEIKEVIQTIEVSEAQVSRLRKRSTMHQNLEGRSVSITGNAENRLFSSVGITAKTTGDFLDNVLNSKRMKSHQPLTATPAGRHTMVTSMNMLSTRVNHGNYSAQKGSGNPGDNGDGGDGGDDPGRGGRSDGERETDPHHNSRHTDRISLAEREMIARLPPLAPEQFYWDGECALLRIMIQKWKKNLSGYSDQMALSFLRRCVSQEWVHLVDTSDSFEECLSKFALHSSNEELYLRRLVEEIRSHPPARTYKQDKQMLSLFEKNIVKITRLNSAYLIDFATAQQLASKLSDNTLKRQYINELTQLRDESSDIHATNNYLVTIQQIINKARIAIDNNLDIEAINRANSKYAQYNHISASSYQVQANTEQKQTPDNTFRRNNGNNQFRGNKRQYNEFREPVNMDARGDLRYNIKGRPIDLTKQEPKRTRYDNYRTSYKASAYYSEGGEPGTRRETGRRRGGNRQDFTQRRGGIKQEPEERLREQEQPTDNNQRPGRGIICKLCNTPGHTDLFYCPKFPEYIPRGNDVKSLPKDICHKCLSYFRNCDHRQFRGFEDYLCKKNDINFLFCNQCHNHTTAQDWAKKNFNPGEGRKILGRI